MLFRSHTDIFGSVGISSLNMHDSARNCCSIVTVTSARAVDSNHSTNVENLADAVKEIILDLPESFLRLGGGGLIQQLVGSRDVRLGSQLLGQVIGQLNEIFVLSDRSAFSLEFHHGSRTRIDAGVNTESTK